MIRLLHTADWQLGLRLNFIPGDAGARLRAERFEVVRRIAALALEREVDAVLVAGDVFDDNGVGNDTLQQARDALTAFGDIPVVLLPGNHDPATPDSALARLGDLGPGIHVALTPEPLRLGERGDLEVLPCPLLQRHTVDDPCQWVPPRADGAEAVRVALAHGGAFAFSDLGETPNLIDVEALLARDVDYVALGDWHGTFEVQARAFYSGTPEPTRFAERDPGNVLIVEIDGPGAVPRVESVPVARSRWLRERVEFTEDADLDRLATHLAELPDKSWTLMRLETAGALSLEARARLDALLEEYAARLVHLRPRGEPVAVRPTDADLAALRADGFLGTAIDSLREGGDAVDDDALVLLYRLLTDVRGVA